MDLPALLAERKDRIFLELPAGQGRIPCLTARGRCLAEAWENSLLAVYAYGCEIRTEYDRKDSAGNFLDPPSRDCTMRLIVEEPLAEPMIHRCFPGGLDSLEEYRQEVLDGIKDHWVRDPDDPEDERWEYTYHERLFRYTVPGKEGAVDQLAAVVEGLARSPISRRCQAITWKVWEDTGIHDPACMQSLWFRILPDEDGVWRLNLNVRFRSRDAYDAAFMNCFALILLQERVARQLSEKTGREVRLGRYLDESDSFHIYGSKLRDFEDRFLKQVMSRRFEQRTWTRAFAEPFFAEARPRIREKIAAQDRQRRRED
ncbi:MAG: hypothetical protein A2V67_00030 [Deltaproteobacteria bacterium RBG_13_61_14]|nr:MAG: hypothetical protein A2V67_00030 [Deltaproteobacteria bacterium RBG_13_61_14]